MDNRIRKCAPKIKSKTVKSVFDDCEAKAELKRLQNDFVIVPIDKAANNLAFICKQHYADIIFLELKYSQILSNTSPSDTYEFITKPPIEIIQEHKNELSKHELEFKEGMDCLPSMYWTPKLHKNPVGKIC